jgi:hypothetical protein
VAFEPDGALFTQYFFVGAPEFGPAGLVPEVSEAIERRLQQIAGDCARCQGPARWLWIPRKDVESLDEVGSIARAPGELLCAAHGARRLCSAFTAVSEANLLYINVPYGEAGAYLWI